MRAERFLPSKQNNANLMYVYIFMGKLFIVGGGGLGSFPFIRMVNNETIVLYLTRTYLFFSSLLLFCV